MQKRVIAVHDISCIGKCSLTVALPILSAAGLETGVIPTAILSTHTGGFTGYTYRDLTQDIRPIAAHWRTLDLKVDAVYTGFLGSFEQFQIVSELFDQMRGSLIFVDPVMGDNGKLYPLFTPEFVRGMARLCEKADMIAPNITEAAFMLGEPYREPPYTRDYIEGLLRRLCAMGPKKAVLTGVRFDKINLGAACIEDGAISYAFEGSVPGYYHGTGDVFASALLAGVMRGARLPEAMEIAVAFTVEAIRRTHDAGTDVRFGVNFEESLPGLIRMLEAEG